jgi:hypothetical protein
MPYITTKVANLHRETTTNFDDGFSGVCFETICIDCTSTKTWMHERICKACYTVFESMQVTHIKEKSRWQRGFLLGNHSHPEDNMIIEDDEHFYMEDEEKEPMSKEAEEAISILSGEDSFHEEHEEANLNAGTRRGIQPLCCSEMIPLRLMDWRDGNEADDDMYF